MPEERGTLVRSVGPTAATETGRIALETCRTRLSKRTTSSGSVTESRLSTRATCHTSGNERSEYLPGYCGPDLKDEAAAVLVAGASPERSLLWTA